MYNHGNIQLLPSVTEAMYQKVLVKKPFPSRQIVWRPTDIAWVCRGHFFFLFLNVIFVGGPVEESKKSKNKQISSKKVLKFKKFDFCIKMKFSGLILSLCLAQFWVETMSSHTHYTRIIIFNFSSKDLMITGFHLAWGRSKKV